MRFIRSWIEYWSCVVGNIISLFLISIVVMKVLGHLVVRAGVDGGRWGWMGVDGSGLEW